MQEILNATKIKQIVNRLAFQILENSSEQEKICLVGIIGNGYKLAEKIYQVLIQNSNIKIELVELKLDKSNPKEQEISISVPAENLTNSFVVLVDDVLNSGKTMQFALIKLLEIESTAIKTVALVDRKHRRFPIKCDFVGLSLSTTIKNHVEVSFEGNQSMAFLL